MDDYLINGETLSNIADKVREKAPETYEGNEVTPEEMPEAVEEVWKAGYNEGIKSVDLSPYQTKHDENLNTESKEIVEAINELNDKIGDGAMDGEDGKTPYIQDGYWYIDGTNTNVKAQGEKGEDGHTPTITIQNGYWYIDGADTGVKAEGANGKDGNDYVLTEADKEEIAGIVANSISNTVTNLTDTTWILNNDINLSTAFTYNVNFESNGNSYSKLKSTYSYNGRQYYYILHYDDTKAYDTIDGWVDTEYQIVSFTGGTDATNTALIDELYTWGKLQEVEYQQKIDENLETDSKEIVGAINELQNGKLPYVTVGGNPGTLLNVLIDAVVAAGGECIVVLTGYYGGSYYIIANWLTSSFGTVAATNILTNSTMYYRGNTTAMTIEDFQNLAVQYQPKSDTTLATTSKEIVGAINELNSKIGTGGSSSGSAEPCLEMPQIRFVGMPCSGWFGMVDWSQIDGEQNSTDENLKFTIEIVSGTLQVGDAIQLCRMSKYSGSTSYAPDGTKKYHPPKRKLRRLFEYTITEEDLEKRFITFEVPWNDKKAMKLFTQCVIMPIDERKIYFRVRRPKGEINSGSNGGGMTVDALFSNVVSITAYSYPYEWYPYGEDDVRELFYHIRIT